MLFRRLVSFIIVIAAALLAFLGAAYFYLHFPADHPGVQMTIEAGTSVREITDALEKKGVIRCAPCFRAYIGLMGIAPRLRAGDYEFESGLTPLEVTTKLLKGDFKRYRITMPEGWTVKDISNHLKTLPFVVDSDFAERFLHLSKDKDVISKLGFEWDIDNLEGYLFPSTYEVYKLKDPEKLISLMAGEFKARFSSKILEGSARMGFKPVEIVTLASIIEKETSKEEEKPLVASVLYNRLKKGMPLQSDPTVIYGLENYDGNVRKADLMNPHKYNTYVHLGFPPGPICNPGEGSISAALAPAETSYLYFVSRNDGTHVFSETLAEHQKNVNKYQRARK